MRSQSGVPFVPLTSPHHLVKLHGATNASFLPHPIQNLSAHLHDFSPRRACISPHSQAPSRWRPRRIPRHVTSASYQRSTSWTCSMRRSRATRSEVCPCAISGRCSRRQGSTAMSLWEHCAALHALASPPMFCTHLGHVVANGRIMAATVEDLCGTILRRMRGRRALVRVTARSRTPRTTTQN